jgi:hypothetical protein
MSIFKNIKIVSFLSNQISFVKMISPTTQEEEEKEKVEEVEEIITVQDIEKKYTFHVDKRLKVNVESFVSEHDEAGKEFIAYIVKCVFSEKEWSTKHRYRDFFQLNVEVKIIIVIF